MKVKVAAIVLLVVANGAYFYWVRVRRPALPAHMQAWQPLSERTSEERAEVIASAFALDKFDVIPLATDSKFVTIPRPETWWEQMIASTKYVNAGPSVDEDDETKEDSELPWHAGLININVLSIAVSAFETVPMGVTNHIVIKEKVISLDGYLSKNGIPIPLLQLLTVGRYYVDEKDNTLLETQRAIQVNGQPMMSYSSDVPLWLVPKRELAIGETWVQAGAHPRGVPNTAPRPEVVRALNRLVIFEGRRAAEISSTSTFYDFSPGKDRTHVKRIEEALVYLDLETGEPLWYEAKDKDDREFESLVRGCNRIFSKHLIRTDKL